VKEPACPGVLGAVAPLSQSFQTRKRFRGNLSHLLQIGKDGPGDLCRQLRKRSRLTRREEVATFCHQLPHEVAPPVATEKLNDACATFLIE
jgi:hypothetical protein